MSVRQTEETRTKEEFNPTETEDDRGAPRTEDRGGSAPDKTGSKSSWKSLFRPAGGAVEPAAACIHSLIRLVTD